MAGFAGRTANTMPARAMKSEANGAGAGLDHADKASSALDGSAPDPTDLANYFCTYAYIYHVRSVTLHASRRLQRDAAQA